MSLHFDQQLDTLAADAQRLYDDLAGADLTAGDDVARDLADTLEGAIRNAVRGWCSGGEVPDPRQLWAAGIVATRRVADGWRRGASS